MDNFSLPERRVPWWAGLLVFTFLVLLLALFSIILRMLMMSVDPATILGGISSPWGLTVQVTVMSALFAGLAFGVPSHFRVPPAKWLRLRPARPSVAGSAAVGVAGLGFLVDETVYLLHRMDPKFFETAGLDVFNQIFRSASVPSFIVLTIVVTLGPGICEELFFRGLVMRSLLETNRRTLAVAVSAVLFGLIHFDVLQSPGAAVIGVYLGVVALRADSLVPAALAHGVNNLICALFARFSTGNEASPIVVGHPPWVLLTAFLVCSFSLLSFFYMTRKVELKQ